MLMLIFGLYCPSLVTYCSTVRKSTDDIIAKSGDVIFKSAQRIFMLFLSLGDQLRCRLDCAFKQISQNLL